MIDISQIQTFQPDESILKENIRLKLKNKTLLFLLLGTIILSSVFITVYFRKEEEEEEEL